MTGLYNRRYLEATLERELLRADRGGHRVGLISVDIDHFKSFNDRHGHSFGDALLQAVAGVLQGHVRGSDMQRAEQLRTAVAALQEPATPVPHRVTVSLGVAVYPDDGRAWLVTCVGGGGPERLIAASRVASRGLLGVRPRGPSGGRGGT